MTLDHKHDRMRGLRWIGGIGALTLLGLLLIALFNQSNQLGVSVAQHVTDYPVTTNPTAPTIARPPLPQPRRSSAEHELTADIQSTVRAFHQAAPDERSKIRERIEDLTSKHFDLLKERRAKELEMLENRIAEIRATQNKREELRETIIESQVNRLLGKPDLLAWDPSAGGPNMTQRPENNDFKYYGIRPTQPTPQYQYAPPQASNQTPSPVPPLTYVPQPNANQPYAPQPYVPQPNATQPYATQPNAQRHNPSQQAARIDWNQFNTFQQIQRLTAELEALKQSKGANHPKVQALRKQLDLIQPLAPSYVAPAPARPTNSDEHVRLLDLYRKKDQDVRVPSIPRKDQPDKPKDADRDKDLEEPRITDDSDAEE